MEDNALTSLSDRDLLLAYQKQKKENVLRAFIAGFFGGIALFSLYFNGLKFWTFFPLFFIVILLKKQKQGVDLKHELKRRGLLSK
jgi:hypothetical protein